jgi:hypothetical protein
MSELFDKLNFKGHSELLVVAAPGTFEAELARLEGVRVLRDPAQARGVRFTLAFVQKLAEVEALAKPLGALAEGDVVLWFAYPKQTSRKYACDFNRDTGWASVAAEGFEPVRQVAIDEDWSALRFRRSAFVKR